MMTYTPEQALNNLRPAFKDLFDREPLDLGRFLRLAIEVFDPDPGVRMTCRADSFQGAIGCGKAVTLKIATRDGRPIGYQCPECGVVYPWAFYDFKRHNPQKIVLTCDGTSRVGACQCVGEASGVTFTDDMRGD